MKENKNLSLEYLKVLKIFHSDHDPFGGYVESREKNIFFQILILTPKIILNCIHNCI